MYDIEYEMGGWVRRAMSPPLEVKAGSLCCVRFFFRPVGATGEEIEWLPHCITLLLVDSQNRYLGVFSHWEGQKCQTPDYKYALRMLAQGRLAHGNIAFNTPDRIPLGKSQIIEAKLSTNMPPNVLLDQLNEAGMKESATIKVAERMIATLRRWGFACWR
jgi:hypothetical protein